MNAQRLFMDIISILPQSIIETILCLLPIQDAARTSILSRDWRYKWTTIPKLDFIEWKFNVSIDDSQLAFLQQTPDAVSQRKSMIKRRSKLFHAIYRVLLMHRSPIHEFSLSVDPDVTCIKIDHIMLLLSRSLALNQLRLYCDYRLPLSIFNGFANLASLYLYNCELYFEPTFNGFGRLTSLYLDEVVCPLETLLHLIANCPLLKSFTLLTELSNIFHTDESAFKELFECLSLIEHLNISSSFIQCLVLDAVPRELPTLLVHLQYFCLDLLSFLYEHGLPALFLLIRSSPNLERIKLQICYEWYNPQWEIDSITLKTYSDIWLEHLVELEIEGMSYLKAEWEFVKLLLAKSPVLKKVSIVISKCVTKDEEIKMLRIFLRSPCASPMVEIIIERHN